VSSLQIRPPSGIDPACVAPFELHVPAQRALWLDTRPYMIVPAARRSGKTHIACWALLREIANPTRGFRPGVFDTYRNAVLGAPTRAQAKLIWWDRVKALIPRDWITLLRESELLLATSTGWLVRVVGLEKPRIAGRPVDFLILDEYGEMRPEVFTKVLRPALATRGHQGKLWLIGSPVGRNHYWNRWCDAQLKGDRWGAYTWRADEVLEPSQIEALRHDLSPRDFREQMEASWEDAAGRIYYAFDRRLDVHEFPLPPGIGTEGMPWLGGMDFNVDPMCAVWGWEQDLRAPDGRIEKHAFVYDAYWARNADTSVAAREIKLRCEQRAGRFGAFMMHPDPSGKARKSSAVAGATDHSLLQAAGFKTASRDAAPSRRDRWNAVNGQFLNAAGRRRVHIHPSLVSDREGFGTSRLITDLEGVLYKEGTSEPDEQKCGQMIHITDATGYWFELRHKVRAGDAIEMFNPRDILRPNA